MSPPGWTTLILLMEEGYSTVRNKCNEDDLKPKIRTSIENGSMKRTVESHRIAKERVRIGTCNVRTLNNVI